MPLRFQRERGPALVLVPPVAFTQAVLNLVENALEESSPEAPVEVDVQRDTGEGHRARGSRPRPRLARDRARRTWASRSSPRAPGESAWGSTSPTARRDVGGTLELDDGRWRRRDRAHGAAGRARSRGATWRVKRSPVALDRRRRRALRRDARARVPGARLASRPRGRPRGAARAAGVRPRYASRRPAPAPPERPRRDADHSRALAARRASSC